MREEEEEDEEIQFIFHLLYNIIQNGFRIIFSSSLEFQIKWCQLRINNWNWYSILGDVNKMKFWHTNITEGMKECRAIIELFTAYNWNS